MNIRKMRLFCIPFQDVETMSNYNNMSSPECELFRPCYFQIAYIARPCKSSYMMVLSNLTDTVTALNLLPPIA
jgi:hypothetical protein